MFLVLHLLRIVILGLVLSIITVARAQESSINVRCGIAEGCWNLIAQAIKQAPENSTLVVSPGLYFESPILINKSLTLKGTLDTGPVIERPVIRAIEPGTLITVRMANRLLVVTIESLTLQSLMLDPEASRIASGEKRPISYGVVIEGSKETSSQKFEVTLHNDKIEAANGGIMFKNKGSIVIKKTKINVLGTAISAGFDEDTESRIGESKVLVEDSQILGDSSSGIGVGPFGIVSLGGVEAIFNNNSISFSSFRAVTSSRQSEIGILGFAKPNSGGRYSLVNNRIALLGIGIYLAGKLDVELSNNVISDMKTFGISLLLRSCFGSAVDSSQMFIGKITGEKNLFTNNTKGNLCPADYPWPPGFLK